MKNVENSLHLEGKAYSQDLKFNEGSKNHPDIPYISGTLSIATDDACLNAVPVNFTYVTAKTRKGNPNATYDILKGFIDKTYKCVLDSGIDEATKLRFDGRITLNEFYSNKNNPNGDLELVSQMRADASFLHLAPEVNADEKARNKFRCDMIIMGVKHVDGNDEFGTADKTVVGGYVFNSYSKAILPVTFDVTTPAGMSYFENLEVNPKSPIFTSVWGQYKNDTVRHNKVTKSAFGDDDDVVDSSRRHYSWVITGTPADTYVWDDESSITAVEVKEALATRETMLATLKQDQIARMEAKNSTSSAPANSFDFSEGNYGF